MGLNVFGLLDKIKQQPSLWEPLYTQVHYSLLQVGRVPIVHIAMVISLYIYYYIMLCKWLKNVLFVEKGSNLRREQYVQFVDFIDECSGK